MSLLHRMSTIRLLVAGARQASSLARRPFPASVQPSTSRMFLRCSSSGHHEPGHNEPRVPSPVDPKHAVDDYGHHDDHHGDSGPPTTMDDAPIPFQSYDTVHGDLNKKFNLMLAGSLAALFGALILV
jgi:hypothetical protein